MIALYILSLAVFVAYIALIVRRFGVPISISESYYLWPNGRGRWWFFAFCLLAALPLMIFWFDVSPKMWQFLVFFGCGPLLFVGAAGEFKDINMTRTVHYVAAGISALASQAWIVICGGGWWIASVVLLAAAVVVSRKINGTDATGRIGSALLFWLELAAFISVYLAVLMA